MAQIGYHRYHIETNSVPDIVKCPSRFRVKVQKHRLILFLIEEILRYPTKKKVIFSRPCIYEVYGRPVGGLAPREHLCVGCLRCTTEHPDWVQIHPNPKFEQMGDSYFSAEYVDAINYEARTGMIPVKGAGFRGKFGGAGWNSMWTDMSEIVRPTRDGIHGREFISTVVDIGAKPGFLTFDGQGLPAGKTPQIISIPLPVLFDMPPVTMKSRKLITILAEAARRIETLAVMPVADIIESGLEGSHIIPLVTGEQLDMLQALPFAPGLIEMAGGDKTHYSQIKSWFPESLVCLRLPFSNRLQEDLLRYADSGIRVFHLVADYHGRGAGGDFMLELVRRAHQALVAAGCRDEVTLLGSGGIVAAEHVPKAIICGLDAVALDTALLVALQAQFADDCIDPPTSQVQLPKKLDLDWGVQRLENMLASWRDQMLEVMGAMGLREVRRLRGEVGRAMFQHDLEKEAFQEISGYGEK
ncbi:glutamate synthase-related protein [Chloroflexota bacterium]